MFFLYTEKKVVNEISNLSITEVKILGKKEDVEVRLNYVETS